LRSARPDIEIECFFDSYRDGSWEGISLYKPAQIAHLDNDVMLVISSVFWSEISDILDRDFSVEYKILSNSLINTCSHLSAFGSFYFEEALQEELEGRLAKIEDKFRSDLDREILRKLFNLRVYRREEEFFDFAERLVRDQKQSFEEKDKYARHLDFDSIRYVIEGGVYDGQDSYRFLQALRESDAFQKLFAFDPFLESLYEGDYFEQMDASRCEFIPSVLWDREERVAFKVDYANPANSTVQRESEMTGDDAMQKTYPAIAIDAFVASKDIPVDLIKLDVEGSEMNVLHGARNVIEKWRPKMAISLYHRREHLLEIPEFLLSLHGDYRFSISVNNASFVDMVLYAS
jgi:FkbM family methyltransferase